MILTAILSIFYTILMILTAILSIFYTILMILTWTLSILCTTVMILTWTLSIFCTTVTMLVLLQLAYAGILSIFYTIVMMLVLVGIIRGAAENGFCSVSTTFLLGVVGVFVVTALLHPMESTAILHGFLYFLSIPSMSMLLLLYSLANLHNVSWGTREVSVLDTREVSALDN